MSRPVTSTYMGTHPRQRVNSLTPPALSVTAPLMGSHSMEERSLKVTSSSPLRRAFKVHEKQRRRIRSETPEPCIVDYEQLASQSYAGESVTSLLGKPKVKEVKRGKKSRRSRDEEERKMQSAADPLRVFPGLKQKKRPISMSPSLFFRGKEVVLPEIDQQSTQKRAHRHFSFVGRLQLGNVRDVDKDTLVTELVKVMPWLNREAVEIWTLASVFLRLDIDEDGVLSEADIASAFRYYDVQKVRRLKDMIWQVDESMEGHIVFADFYRWYVHCRKEEGNALPGKMLFYLVEYMIIDENGDGRLDYDECIRIAYHRYGREGVEAVTKQFESHRDMNSLHNEMDFSEFARMMDDMAAEAEEQKRKEMEESGIFGKAEGNDGEEGSRSSDLVRSLSSHKIAASSSSRRDVDGDRYGRGGPASKGNKKDDGFKNVKSKYKEIERNFMKASIKIDRSKLCTKLMEELKQIE
uniref:Calmodulin n=1 Tax=Palpitomonas bilix TaxID=652834 RepID=A0A7S3GIR8_9EUKA|mmetsp:Transcript_5252/g.11671  ORF Transcript_5252/g.11671 Transcript_5252/m.11671 type:complete len:466 (+) Transcript_5252:186-1583(+)